jgi:hypothetical protein
MCKETKLITEWCSHCEQEVEIPPIGRSNCPNCGESILPCSMCEECVENCPYEE